MYIYRVCSLLILLTLFLPVAQAEEIDMRAGSVRINRDSRGNVNIDTGKTNVNLPGKSTPVNRTPRANNINSSRRINNPIPRLSESQKTIIRTNCGKSGSVVSQTTTQITTVRGSNTKRSQSSASCR
jgi:hypothetical protein